MPLKHQNGSPLDAINEIRKELAKLPVIVANTALNHFLKNFKTQSWEGEKWKTRSGWSSRKQGDGILNATGTLMRALTSHTNGANVRVYVKAPADKYADIHNEGGTITIPANMPYAQAHNEGFKGTVAQNVKAHRRKVKSRNTYTKYKTETGKTKREKQSSGVAFVKAFTRVLNMNLPQRQFMGDSRFFMKRLNAIFENRIKQIER